MEKYVMYTFEPGMPAPGGAYNVHDTLEDVEWDFGTMYRDEPGAWCDIYLQEDESVGPVYRMTIGPRGGVNREVWR